MQELQFYRLTTQTLRKRNSHKEGDSGSTQELFDSDQQRTAPCTACAWFLTNRAASAARGTGRPPRSPRLRNALENCSHRKTEIAVANSAHERTDQFIRHAFSAPDLEAKVLFFVDLPFPKLLSQICWTPKLVIVSKDEESQLKAALQVAWQLTARRRKRHSVILVVAWCNEEVVGLQGRLMDGFWRTLECDEPAWCAEIVRFCVNGC